MPSLLRATVFRRSSGGWLVPCCIHCGMRANLYAYHTHTNLQRREREKGEGTSSKQWKRIERKENGLSEEWATELT